MDKNIGFIGCGNMAEAMIGSIVKSNLVPAENITATKRKVSAKERLAEKYGINIISNNKQAARQSDFLILAVKPHIYETVLEEIRDDIKKDAVVIGIAAGISSDYLKNKLNEGTKYIKIMPNTPAMVGEGMTAVVINDSLEEHDIDELLKILNSFGRTEMIEERLMDGFTGLCGSSPAYIYMLIEAMADAGVLEGIPRAQSYTMAAQSVLGAAKMVLETGLHPGQLKDNVCSPGGTTIEAVISLEESGFRSSMMNAIKVCSDKSRKMSETN